MDQPFLIIDNGHLKAHVYYTWPLVTKIRTSLFLIGSTKRDDLARHTGHSEQLFRNIFGELERLGYPVDMEQSMDDGQSNIINQTMTLVILTVIVTDDDGSPRDMAANGPS